MSESPYKNFKSKNESNINPLSEVDEYFEKRKIRSEMSTPLININKLSKNDIPVHIDRKSLHFDFVGQNHDIKDMILKSPRYL